MIEEHIGIVFLLDLLQLGVVAFGELILSPAERSDRQCGLAIEPVAESSVEQGDRDILH